MKHIHYNSKLIEKRIILNDTGEKVCKNPFVSIVIPAYNVADFIAETLDSALMQTFQDFEIIVVNDGSPDTEKLEKVLKDYFSKLVYIKQINGGAAAARNTAIHFAKGEFIAFLDGDDIWLPNKLEKQVDFIKANDLDLTYCNAYMFGEKIWDGKNYMELSKSQGKVTVESLLSFECNFITSGTVVRREKVIEVCGFDENRKISGAEDFDLWFRLVKNGCKTDYQEDVLLKYRAVVGSLSGGNIERAARTLNCLNYVRGKNELTQAEQKIWDFEVEKAEANIEIEKGKYYLVKEDFEQAKKHLKKANIYYKKTKYSIVILLLNLSPKLLLKFFKEKRNDEFSFISANNRD
jgi:glycosyltransferase involved in cell wall biosynthesis